MNIRFITVSERILLTLWVGGLWIIGYMAVPTLFSFLDDRKLAGSIAGEMFSFMNYIGLVCGIALFLSVIIRNRRSWQVWIIFAMLTLVSVGAYILQPTMQELKTIGIAIGSPEAEYFKRLHIISSILYLITSLMGLSLVVFGLHRRADIE
ncbi:MAG: DUF4149 domain-containing protein [Thiohalomonadales bacterium]